MEKVALIKCVEYEVELVEEKLREGFELLGGDEFLKRLIPKVNVLLKPNMLSVEAKGSPVVTHYVVFEAVIRIIKDILIISVLVIHLVLEIQGKQQKNPDLWKSQIDMGLNLRILKSLYM